MNEFSRIEDILYSLTNYTHLKFQTKVTEYIDNRVKSNYNEYKTSTRNYGSVVIKRKLNFYLTLENTNKENRQSIIILPEQMYEVLDKFNYIRETWFNPRNNLGIFGLVNEKLVVINQRATVIIQCIGDKFLKIDPTVYKSENGDKMALTMYIGDTSNPILIFPEKFIGMTYLLSTFDMLNFANTTFSLASLRTSPVNRVSFVDGESEDNKLTTPGKVGRDFKFKQDSNII